MISKDCRIEEDVRDLELTFYFKLVLTLTPIIFPGKVEPKIENNERVPSPPLLVEPNYTALPNILEPLVNGYQGTATVSS